MENHALDLNPYVYDKMNAVKYTFLLALLYCIHPVMATTQNDSLAQKIEHLIQLKLPNTPIGIVIRNAKTGNILYSKNAQHTFIPASNTKLFTASAALLTLGTHYQFETQLKEKGGNLYVQFSGDPSLTIQDLTALMQAAKTTGTEIKQISIDDTQFEGLEYALGWEWNSTWWYYGAPITTVMLNTNAMPIQLLPAAPGEKIIAQFKKMPGFPIMPSLTHDLISVTNEEAKQCVFMINTNTNNDTHLSGCWPAQKEATSIKIAIKNPTLVAKQIILDALNLNKNKTSDIKTGISIKNLTELKTLATHRSKSLQSLLPQILQDSDNIYTESLTKTLGATFANQGTFQAGVQVIQKTLTNELGLDFTRAKMMDGSGLSRYNLVTPHLFSELLYKMHHHPMGSIFKNALATSGKSGTLKSRLQPDNQNDTVKIYAKTGTLTGVSSLSGYLETKDNQTFIFSIMINNALQDAYTVKTFEDDLCQLIYETL